MNYLIVSDGVISNIIVCSDEQTASALGALPWYEGAGIGAAYSPPPGPPTLEDRVGNLETSTTELQEALDMILTGYTGEGEGTDETGTAE